MVTIKTHNDNHYSDKRIISLDSSILNGAGSFITRPASLRDPHAQWAFEAVITPFCNGAELSYPVPHRQTGVDPWFVDAWAVHGTVQVVTEGALTDAESPDVLSAFMPKFESFAKGSTDLVASWLAFHFGSDEYPLQYVSRTSHDFTELRQVSGEAARIIESGRLDHVLRRTNEFWAERGVSFPSPFVDLIGSPDFPSVEHLQLSFVLSVYLRGWSYAMSLTAQNKEAIYRHHWLRAPILSDPRIVKADNRMETLATWFPWGSVFSLLIERYGWIARERNAVIEHAIKVRELSAGVDAALAWSKLEMSEEQSLRAEAEEVIIDALLRAGLVPKYSDTTRPRLLLECLKKLAAVRGPLTRLVVDTVSPLLDSKRLRRSESDLRRSFRRDTYWDVFQKPDLRPVIDKWMRALDAAGSTRADSDYLDSHGI